MKPVTYCIVIFSTYLIFLTGCATYSAYEVGPTPIMHAEKEIPEDQLMDVGILVFDSRELDEETAKDEGTHPEIRKAESHFIPYHLKNTLHQSSHWGAVRVLPGETNSVDLLVTGEILASNGEHLVLKVEVTDASGKVWLTKTYEEEASEVFYSGNSPGEKDAFQDLYNMVANDIANYKQQLSAAEIENIRTISKLKFARDFAPDAYDDYLKQTDKEQITINRLPADDDPMMERLASIRERDYMFIDTLNEYYADFHAQMEGPYDGWRSYSYEEQDALDRLRRQARIEKILGVAAIVGGIWSSTQGRSGAAAGEAAVMAGMM